MGSAGQVGGVGEGGVLAGHQLEAAGHPRSHQQPADRVPTPQGASDDWRIACRVIQ
jgi:hypothetical protein